MAHTLKKTNAIVISKSKDMIQETAPVKIETWPQRIDGVSNGLQDQIRNSHSCHLSGEI
eukprot:CAMPEP_0196597982 /NCGR_PEP_ID=MMETSP1081-20130531/94041_1 /TAXON_ID=36882 /ORGANISM="Pyramimonas amylifera, Strain CCMP720" /LENGTH=58 /DNA_ID=CAMNT_0041923583 /DNA_START=345 /DNA_END=521 /DNA_ORIENTATION=+